MINRRFKNSFFQRLTLYPKYGAEAADPGMCDFPIRQESGTGNRIPSGFFACFDLRVAYRLPPGTSAVHASMTAFGCGVGSSHWQGIVRKRPLLLLRCSVLARTTDAAAESHRAYTNGRGARRKPKATKQVLRRHEVSGEADAPAA